MGSHCPGCGIYLPHGKEVAPPGVPDKCEDCLEEADCAPYKARDGANDEAAEGHAPDGYSDCYVCCNGGPLTDECKGCKQ